MRKRVQPPDMGAGGTVNEASVEAELAGCYNPRSLEAVGECVASL